MQLGAISTQPRAALALFRAALAQLSGIFPVLGVALVQFSANVAALGAIWARPGLSCTPIHRGFILLQKNGLGLLLETYSFLTASLLNIMGTMTCTRNTCITLNLY